jgi:hypothetical protein
MKSRDLIPCISTLKSHHNTELEVLTSNLKFVGQHQLFFALKPLELRPLSPVTGMTSKALNTVRVTKKSQEAE